MTVDDRVTNITVNGQSTGLTAPFNTPTQFVIPQILQPGSTTIIFSVYNVPNGSTFNPEGLKVEWLSATINAPTPTPTPTPRLTITKSALATAVTNSNLTYTLTYANTSNVSASGVVIRDPLPSGTTFVSATNGGTVSNGVVVFNIGTVNANTSGKVSFTVRVTAPESATVTNSGYTIEATSVAPVTGPNVVTSATAASKIALPWAKTNPTAPADTSDFFSDCGGMGSGDGGVGASAGDPVNLSSGQESYQPAADLMAYNPNGLNAAWQRAFSTEQSLNGYGTPGLARG